MNNLTVIFWLLCVLGFLVGFVAGYFFNGVAVEKRCEAYISRLSNFIAHRCVNAPSEGVSFNFSFNLSERGVSDE